MSQSCPFPVARAASKASKTSESTSTDTAVSGSREYPFVSSTMKNYIFTRVLTEHVLAESMEKALKVHNRKPWAGELLACDEISQDGERLGGILNEEVAEALEEHMSWRETSGEVG